MPEEIGIVVIFGALLLFGVGWAFVAVLMEIGRGYDNVSRSIQNAVAARRDRSFKKRRHFLSKYVLVNLPDELGAAQSLVARLRADLQAHKGKTDWEPTRPTWEKKRFAPHVFPPKTELWEQMDVAQIAQILCPEQVAWSEKESMMLAMSCNYPAPPPIQERVPQFVECPIVDLSLQEATFEVDRLAVKDKEVAKYFETELSQVKSYNLRRQEILASHAQLVSLINAWNAEERQNWLKKTTLSEKMFEEEIESLRAHARQYTAECSQYKGSIAAILSGYRQSEKAQVLARTEFVLADLKLPKSLPRSWEIDFDEHQRILMVELPLPNIIHVPPFKMVQLKSGLVKKPLSQTERKENVPRIHPAILLRLAYEIYRNDESSVVRLLVLNGWVTFDDPQTGTNRKAYTASLVVERDQVASLDLRRVDPLAAFQSLHGKSAGRIMEIVPIEPTLHLDRKDSRFVDPREVLGGLEKSTNLAGMDWQDFEHLIRELFQKEFSGRGTEVNITQASRDRGVDAIAFDPDPIRGGKFIIQAKRYTNTVGVSAVRDLCAVVRKEGASRGILVTTSAYGADAYAFANNEPVTLLDGAGLLGLLAKHGYSFRINLQEARNYNN